MTGSGLRWWARRVTHGLRGDVGAAEKVNPTPDNRPFFVEANLALGLCWGASLTDLGLDPDDGRSTSSKQRWL